MRNSVAPNQSALDEYFKTTERAKELQDEGLLSFEEMVQVIAQATEKYEDLTGLTEDRERAQEVKNSLLTEEQLAAIELISLESELLDLKNKGLITEEQRKAYLEARADKEQSTVDYMKEGWESIKENYFTLDAIGSLLSDTFNDIGAALASGDSVLEASGKALQSFASDLLSEISTLAIGAGLRLIVEGGLAALPAAIALFALGGLAGIGGGFFGSSGAGVDSSLQDSMADEIAIRESLNDALQESLDLEKQMLRRQLDRNLITADEYIAGIKDINQQQNQSNAQAELLSAANKAVSDIDSELSDMSGWQNFGLTKMKS